MRFDVFQQWPPRRLDGDEYAARVESVGHIERATAAEAIDSAKEMPCFRYATGLAKYPIVAPAPVDG